VRYLQGQEKDSLLRKVKTVLPSSEPVGLYKETFTFSAHESCPSSLRRRQDAQECKIVIHENPMEEGIRCP